MAGMKACFLMPAFVFVIHRLPCNSAYFRPSNFEKFCSGLAVDQKFGRFSLTGENLEMDGV